MAVWSDQPRYVACVSTTDHYQSNVYVVRREVILRTRTGCISLDVNIGVPLRPVAKAAFE